MTDGLSVYIFQSVLFKYPSLVWKTVVFLFLVIKLVVEKERSAFDYLASLENPIGIGILQLLEFKPDLEWRRNKR